MLGLLWLLPALPLSGFLVLTTTGGRLPRRAVAIIGVGSAGACALLALLLAWAFLAAPPPGHAYVQTLWTWLSVAGLAPAIALRLDALSLAMVLAVTVVGLLIHVYSSGFMREERGYKLYFAYLNLLVAALLILALADNLLLLYLGWEAVGLCSYLLVGFRYRDSANGRAAHKVFMVTRAGDAALAIGLLLLFTQLGTLEIAALMERATARWPEGSGLALAAALLLLAGAAGRSAQLPLQTWLPDATAAPAPASALIHAITVTAGVYLIARTHALYALAPSAQAAIAAVGALTLLLAACSALAQRDILRILAYATIGQAGYMFLALGVGAWSAAVFHLMTHALTLALLFLGAGAVVLALGGERDIVRMGGLRRALPAVFWPLLIGAASLAALPLVAAGFYSKDLILSAAWSSAASGPWLWAAGWAGALLTGLYTFRMVFVVFFGEAGAEIVKRPGLAMTAPLAVLALLCLAGGLVQTPPILGGITLFSDVLRTTLPSAPAVHAGSGFQLAREFTAAEASLLGLGLAYLLFLRYPRLARWLARGSVGAALRRFWAGGWGLDTLYGALLVRPYVWIVRANRHDVVDAVYDGLAWLARLGQYLAHWPQTGQVRWYAACVAAGAVVLIGLALLS